MKRLIKFFCLFTAASCIAATPLLAVDYSWNAASGYANDATKWLPVSGYPGGSVSDNATIDNGGVVLIDDGHQFGGPLQMLTVGFSGSGAVLQSGGNVMLNNGLEMARNVGSYGYYQLSSGTATTTGGDNGNCNHIIGDYGVGVYSQTGGTMNASPVYTVVGWHGGSSVTSQMSITGGSYIKNGGHLLIGWGSNGIVNIGGTADVDVSDGYVHMTNIDTGHLNPTAILNLGSVGTGGGILRTTAVHRFDRWDAYPDDYQSTVNFHGGTLQATGVNTEWWAHGFLCTKSVYIYGEGATIDTNGFDEAVISSLEAPAGKGITGIALDAGSHGSGFIGEPIVTISDATGSGATARAILNGSGGIDHIEITNPGTGYSDAPTFTITGGGAAAVPPTWNPTTSVTVASNVSGGFTKTGLGNLSLNANCTYTGPTVIQKGTLALNDISLASSGITVKSGGTLAGKYVTNTLPAYPITTVESGGAIAPGTPGQTFYISDVLLESGANLNFTFSPLGDAVDTITANTVTPAGGGPITVNVNYANLPASAVTPLMYGALDPNITFTLFGGVPVLDSPDGVSAPASLDASSGYELDLIRGGILTDSVPAWNVLGAGNWTEDAKWSNNVVPIVNQHPNGGGDRGLFVKTLGTGLIPISLNISPRLSSMIFASPTIEGGGESYKITPASGAETITLNSGIAQNWHITVLSGTHEVAAGLKLGVGTGTAAGQSAIRLANDSHLTLSGPIGDETTAAGVNFDGNFVTGGVNLGVLTLSGLNTYSGPTLAMNGTLEVTSITNHGVANSLGKSGAAPANLVLNNAKLHYLGTTTASTDRGFTIKGSSTVQLEGNAAFAGQIVGDASSALTVTGPGTLALGYAGAGGSTIGTLYIKNGALSILEGAQLTTLDRCDIGNLGTGRVTMSGTSTTAPAKLSIGGTSWMGVNYPEGTPSSAIIELSGTAEMHIGTAHPDANCHLGYGTDSSGSINMIGNSKFTVETANPYSNQNWGWFNIGDLGATADITLSNYASFAVTQSQMCIAGSTGGKGHVTLNDSATFSVAGGVHLGGWAGIGAEAIVNLNGGVFTAQRFIGEGPAAVINLNSGVLKANASIAGFLQGNGLTANVQAGGAKIDTDGYNASVVCALQHDSTPGAPAIDGGLTKFGAGTLALNSQSTYTGPTVVNDGTLQLLSKVISQMASAPDNAAGDRADGPYALGRDFTVNAGKSIQVTQLGVFDSLGNGLDASHVVHITNTVTNAETIATIASGTSAAYQRGFRFVTLESPVSLGEGAYRVWVESIGGAGNDNFSGNLVSFDVGGSGAVSIGGSYYGVTTGVIPSTPWNDGSGDADADATFRFYDPSSVIAANALPITTPVLLGGAAGSTPKLDLQGMNQQIASLADVAGAAVKGAVVNSDSATPVVLTLGGTTGTTTYGGSIEGNLSLVKTGGSTQILTGSLTYSGNTDIQAGTVEIATPGAVTLTTVTGSDSGVLAVRDGTTLTATSIQIGTLTIGGSPSVAAAAVPEPGTLALLALAVLGGIGMAWHKRRL